MAPRTRKQSKAEAPPREKRKRDDVKSESEGEPPVKASKTETEDQTASTDVKPSPSAETKAESPTKQSSAASTLKWLLSDEAFQLANPPIEEGHGEVDWGQGEDGRPRPEALPPIDDKSKSDSDSKPNSKVTGAGGFRYPQLNMTPYQTLLSSLLLSKPLSHRLGIRTINTLFKPPYSFDIFENLAKASEDERRASLWEARTQHKEKTAAQLTSLVKSVQDLSNEGREDELSILRDEIKGLKKEQAIDWTGKRLNSVNGIGKGGIDIFCRGIQAQWEEIYPFADKRCLAAAEELGLIHSNEDGAEELASLIKGDEGGKEEREKFVKLLYVIIGLDLEKKIEEVKEKLGV